MSYHKARPNQARDPNQPYATIMHNGRVAAPHGEVEGKPILGGLQNALVEGPKRTAEEDKTHVQDYHKQREEVKKSHAEYFDKKTGKPKVQTVEYAPDPVGDSDAAPASDPPEREPSPEEKKKVAEGEKKNNEGVKQPETLAAKPSVTKVEEKK